MGYEVSVESDHYVWLSQLAAKTLRREISYLNNKTGHPKYKDQVFTEEELFDLSTDPDELHNLAESEVHLNAKSKLSKRLDEWMHEMGDKGIESERESLRRYPRKN